MPIAWKGTLAQYAGRLHRLHGAKREVVVYDYLDSNVPVLARLAAKRRSGYQAIGYRLTSDVDLFVAHPRNWPVRLRGTENRHKDFTNPLTPRGTDRWLRDGR